MSLNLPIISSAPDKVIVTNDNNTFFQTLLDEGLVFYLDPSTGSLTDRVHGRQATFTRAGTPYVPDASRTVPANYARIIEVGGKKGVYLEPGGASPGPGHNQAKQSQTLGAVWVSTNSSVGANSTTAPDGTLTADTIIEDTDVGQVHYLGQSIAHANFTDNAAVTLSVWLKQKERTWARLAINDKAAGGAIGSYYDLGNGTLGTNDAGTSDRISSNLIQGFWRCELTIDDIGAGANNPAFTIVVATADGTASYNGDGSGIYAWGAQVEEFPVATSYVPTVAAAVTRASESGFPSWTLPTGVFDDKGTVICWVRSGYAYDDMPADLSGKGIVTSSNAGNRVLYHKTSGGVGYFSTFDGTTEGNKATNFAAHTWYKLAVQFPSSPGKFRVGVDSGSGMSWGSEANWDGSYTFGANLRLAYGLYGPMYIGRILAFNRVKNDNFINALAY